MVVDRSNPTFQRSLFAASPLLASFNDNNADIVCAGPHAD